MLIVVLVLVGMYSAFVYTGLQSGKPNLQINSIWATAAARNDVFENNLINMKICNTGNSDVNKLYRVVLNNKGSKLTEYSFDGDLIKSGKCKDYSINFGNLDLYNQKVLKLTGFVDSENKINELSETDNKKYSTYEINDYLPNFKLNSAEVTNEKDFMSKKILAEVCDYPKNAKNNIQLPFTAGFTVNGIKKIVNINKQIISGECIKIESPKFSEFYGLKNSNKLSIFVSVNEDKKIFEQTYSDNTFSSFGNI